MGSGGIKQTLNWDWRGGKALLPSWSECWIDGKLLLKELQRALKLGSHHQATDFLFSKCWTLREINIVRQFISMALYFHLKKGFSIDHSRSWRRKAVLWRRAVSSWTNLWKRGQAHDTTLKQSKWHELKKHIKSKKKSVCWHADGIVSTLVYELQQVLPTQSGSKFNRQSRGAEESTLRYFFRSSICSLHCCWASKRVFM